MESASDSNRLVDGEAIARISPTLTVASGGAGLLGGSRPSTQATVRDGILIRWNDDSNPMLRRPRTASSSGQTSNRSSAKMTKARFNVALKRQKVTGMVKALASAVPSKPKQEEQTAAELCYEASQDYQQPQREAKQRVIRQYNLQNGIVLDKMELPSIPPAEIPASRTGNPFAVKNEAIRQLANSSAARHSFNYLSQPPMSSSTRSCSVYSRAALKGSSGYCRVSRKSTSRSLDEYQRIIGVANLVKETDSSEDSITTESRPTSSTSVRTYCNKVRPQTAASAHHREVEKSSPTASQHRQLRAKSCIPRLRFQETENRVDDDQVEYSISKEGAKEQLAAEDGGINVDSLTHDQPIPNNSRSSTPHRSCWLSPLEMCNVPPDRKLKYITNSEKKRFDKIMIETSRLLRNESRTIPISDKLLKQRRNYRPDFSCTDTDTAQETDADDEAVRANIHLKLSQVLESSKDDALLQKLASNVSSNSFKKKQGQGHHNGRNCDSPLSPSHPVDPTLPLASHTTKALIAGFYLMMRDQKHLEGSQRLGVR